MSIRVSIKDAIVTQLLTISGIKIVSERLQMPEDLGAGDFPALMVVMGAETKKDHDVGHLICEMEAIITGYVKDDADPTGALDTLMASVETKMCADRFWAGKAINTIPSNLITDKGTLEPFAIFDFSFRITYVQPYGTP